MLGSLALTLALVAPSLAARSDNETTWTGWNDVKYFFVFGDSYTQTGFNVSGPQPSPSNPMGNPAYPGWTSSNGPNWVDFLTYNYNASYLQTYNLAYGGATVDAALVKPYAPEVLSLKDQVNSLYLPTYGANSTSVPWTSSNSLFAFFIGINDVGNSWWLDNATAIYDQIFTEYNTLLENVYETGARSFLFLTVPPVNLSPMILNQDDGGWAAEHMGPVIEDFNARIRQLARRFAARHGTSTWTFVHDTHQLYADVIKNVAATPQTSGLKNVTAFCKAYANGTPTWYTFDPNCAYPVNEYLWLNDLHPTFPMHNATAASVVDYLNAMT
ncbi:hypothetical protein BDV95DRAFT_675690 [Massariosphaeria phaeospora]|uniref:Carbohydrate esterase family 16 protein n=1 Tax=Massariosphaeria phaeospora TaxID=100035 RepID=A0A7C8ME55_9PLEO|nr:hypothetical protein BDV95DRAFT_675690 [Massariosphaeria phaeospora]